MDWIVFGDDWGGHPSTTQHLVHSLPAGDRVIWLDSLGMRTPSLTVVDAKRIWNKARSLLERDGGSSATSQEDGDDRRAPVARIKPKVLPFHLNRAAQRFNGWSLARDIHQQMQNLSINDPVLLTSVPVVSPYLQQIPHRKLAYLRLDDYALLPGCDSRLVEVTEEQIFERADVVFGSARALLPTEPWNHKAHYLPQGVDWSHFGAASIAPAGKRVLGFFGLLAEWIDFALIEAVARSAPDWQLEFIGPVRHLPERVRTLANVRLLPGVPFAELPGVLGDWAAAWIPFEVSELTKGVNPLKVREYLAAGLPTHSTPLPEVAPLREVFISDAVEEIVSWLERSLAEDSAERRQARRDSVKGDSWQNRASEMAAIIEQA